jgi:hypothetical protein
MNAELNKADAAFVASKVDAQLKVSDITTHVKSNVAAGAKKRKGKTIALKEFLAQYTDNMQELKQQARDLCYLERSIPEATYEGFAALLSRQRATRAGGSFAKLPPNDPKEQLRALAKRVDAKMLEKETVQLEMVGLKTELKRCREAVNSKDAAAAAIAEITIKKLTERRIPDVERTLRRAVEAEADALRDLRNARQTPMLGGLQKVARGSAEDRS